MTTLRWVEFFGDRIARRFVLVGLLNTAFGYALILLLRLGVGEYAANALSYVVATPVAYLTHRHWTFAHRAPARESFPRYLLSVSTAFVANLIALAALLACGLAGALAQAGALGAHFLAKLTLARLYVFSTCSRSAR